MEDEVMDAHQFLRLVAGDLCPCGHSAAVHEPPTGDLPGEKWGACRRVAICDCKGMLEALDD